MLMQLLPALRATILLAFITGLIFPLAITGIAQLLFPDQAGGSLIAKDGKQGNSASQAGAIVGSRLLGQAFSRNEYFHPRPSAAGSGYCGEASGGSNLAPTSRKLIFGDKDFAGVQQLTESYRKENGLAADGFVPVDAVTRSSSGLDPDISLENANLQVARVAKARNMDEAILKDIVHKHTQGRQCEIFGEPRVNVLLLNLSLDRDCKTPAQAK